jgi:hypothetical protein
VAYRTGGAYCERRLSLSLSPRSPSLRFSPPLIEPDVTISVIRLSDGFHGRHSQAIPLGRRVQRPLEPPEFCGGCQARANPPPLGSSKRTPNQGPFPPLALPSFLGTMGPSDACLARPPKEPVPGRPGRATGLPCCQSPRAYVLRPLPRRAERSSCVGPSDRPRRPSSNERRLGARIQPFGACSGFTRVAARTLADPPKADLCPRGFDGSVALAVSRVATKVYRHLLGPDLHRLR